MYFFDKASITIILLWIETKNNVQIATMYVATTDGLVGLVVKASASRAEDPGLESRLRRDFSGVESYQ